MDTNRLTSTDALSDCTSQSLSNCSTRASGSTNHCMTSHSRMPAGQVSAVLFTSTGCDNCSVYTFANVRQQKRLDY